MGTTLHGQQRMNERLGGTKDKNNVLVRAYNKGRDISEYSPKSRVRKFLEEVRRKTAIENTLKVFGNDVYIFNDEHDLVTVLHIPQSCQRAQIKGGRKWRL